jgi:DNA-binding response OmpR family regulator
VSKVVLVVEDDPSLMELLTRVLEEEGDVVHRATTIAAARKAAFSGGIDVILLDRMLPDGDGADLCVELREQMVETPILLLTARAEAADRIKGLRSGADDYLVKPFELEELLSKLAALVR